MGLETEINEEHWPSTIKALGFIYKKKLKKKSHVDM